MPFPCNTHISSSVGRKWKSLPTAGLDAKKATILLDSSSCCFIHSYKEYIFILYVHTRLYTTALLSYPYCVNMDFRQVIFTLLLKRKRWIMKMHGLYYNIWPITKKNKTNNIWLFRLINLTKTKLIKQSKTDQTLLLFPWTPLSCDETDARKNICMRLNHTGFTQSWWHYMASRAGPPHGGKN